MHDASHEADEDSLLDQAARAGYELVTRISDTGQVVWEWHNGHGPRPQFVSERVARNWMMERIDGRRTDRHARTRRSTSA
jgi:hypothetical protein